MLWCTDIWYFKLSISTSRLRLWLDLFKSQTLCCQHSCNSNQALYLFLISISPRHRQFRNKHHVWPYSRHYNGLSVDIGCQKWKLSSEALSFTSSLITPSMFSSVQMWLLMGCLMWELWPGLRGPKHSPHLAAPLHPGKYFMRSKWLKYTGNIKEEEKKSHLHILMWLRYLKVLFAFKQTQDG